MKHFFLAFLFLNLIMFSCSENKNEETDYQWTKTFYNSFYDIILNNDDFYIHGSFTGTIDFDPSNKIDNHSSTPNKKDFFISKFSKNGDYQWTKIFELGQYNRVKLNNNNIYIYGEFIESRDFNPNKGIDKHTPEGRDYFITKLDNKGDYKWTKIISDKNTLSNISFDKTNNLYIYGSFEGTIDFDFTDGVDTHISEKKSDAYITKIDSEDNYLWTKTFSSFGDDYPQNIIFDKSEIPFVLIRSIYDSDPGSNAGKYTLTNLNDKSYEWNIFNLIFLRTKYYNNKFYFYGNFRDSMDFNPTESEDIHNSTDTAFFITELDEEGNYKYTKIFENNREDLDHFSYKDLIFSNNEIYVYGLENIESIDDVVTSQFFIIKLIDGEEKWRKNFITQKIVRMKFYNNNFYIYGNFKKDIKFSSNTYSSNGVNDIFITKLNNEGDYQWTKTIGGLGNDIVFDTDIDDDFLYIRGSFSDSVDFDPSDNTDIKSYKDGKNFITKIQM